jgi:TM2 domain-containing membrane protein YozV
VVLIYKKDPGLASVFSAIFPGLGQMYNEQLFKGILFLIVEFIIVVIVLGLIYEGLFFTFGGESLWFVAVLFVILYFAIYLIAIKDASNSARKINREIKKE